MPAKRHSGQIGTGIANPGADEDQPHKIDSMGQLPGQIDEKKEHGRIESAEERGHNLLRLINRKAEYIDEHLPEEQKNENRESQGKIPGQRHGQAIQEDARIS